MLTWLLSLACSPDPQGSFAPGDHIVAENGDEEDSAEPGCQDLNCDGWPDAVVSEAWPGATKIFWGSADGFGAGEELPVEWAKGNAQVDLDLDGDLDLVISRLMGVSEPPEYETESYLFYTDGLDPYTPRVETLPTNGAHGVAAGDLNGDGWPDVVFANHGDAIETIMSSYVYWNGPDGFSADDRLELPSVGAHGVTLGDVDADGRLDVVLSNYFDGDTRDLMSYVYLNGEDGLDPKVYLEIPTIGARGSQVVDLDQDGFVDLLFANHYDNLHMDLDSVAYLGGEDGFSEDTVALFPTIGAHTMEVADCDEDGYLDVFWANQREDTAWTTSVQSWLYRGSADGWSEDDRVTLDTHGASGTSARDLNQDGWVDLVVSSFREGEVYDWPTYIYWGGPDCWSDDDRSELASSAGDGVTTGPDEMGF